MRTGDESEVTEEVYCEQPLLRLRQAQTKLKYVMVFK